jgi:hypothetical protein
MHSAKKEGLTTRISSDCGRPGINDFTGWHYSKLYTGNTIFNSVHNKADTSFKIQFLTQRIPVTFNSAYT